MYFDEFKIQKVKMYFKLHSLKEIVYQPNFIYFLKAILQFQISKENLFRNHWLLV